VRGTFPSGTLETARNLYILSAARLAPLPWSVCKRNMEKPHESRALDKFLSDMAKAPLSRHDSTSKMDGLQVLVRLGNGVPEL
jgi:hypothetical protein